MNETIQKAIIEELAGIRNELEKASFLKAIEVQGRVPAGSPEYYQVTHIITSFKG